MLGVESAHIVAHDMGDSVVTEILARHQRHQLPSHFQQFFRSVTFTNGGMVYHLINFRSARQLSSTCPSHRPGLTVTTMQAVSDSTQFCAGKIYQQTFCSSQYRQIYCCPTRISLES